MTSKSDPLTRASDSSPSKAAIGRDGHQPVAAIVGHKHPVLLQSLAISPARAAESSRRRSRAAAGSARPCGQRGSSLAARKVRCRIHVRAARPPDGERASRARRARAPPRRSGPIAGKIGRPAASADVQPSGRRPLEREVEGAACDASQPASVRRACQNSCSRPLTGSTTIR